MLVRGIGRHVRSRGRSPALDEVVCRVVEFLGEVRVDLDRAAGSDPEIVEPRAEQFRFDLELLRERRQLQRLFGGARFGRRRQTLGSGREDPFTPRHELAVDATHIAEQQVRSAGRHQSRTLPHDIVVLVSIAGVTGGQIERDLLLIRCGRQLHPQFLSRRQGCHRFLPALGAADLPDVTDAGEPPQPLLPQTNLRGQRFGLIRFGRAPARSHGVQQQRRLWVRIAQRPPEQSEILRVHSPFLGDSLDRLAPRRERVPFDQRGGDVLLDGQPSAIVGLEDDPLQVDARGAAGIRMRAVHCADLHERVVRPVTRRVRWREPDAVGQQHRMLRDLLGGVEILRDQSR